MQVKDMSVDWYASKNAWMTGEIHHQIMSKLNNEMRLSNHHTLYVCDNASRYQVREYSHIKFLMLPPNATSIMQPLDQGIILSAKRRYKKKLAERYLACVENNKDANSLLKALDIVQATNMIAASWRETSSTIILNCFCKAGFKYHAVDPAPPEEEPLPAPAPDVWNRVQRWLYKARHTHKHLYTVLPKYSKIQVLPGITSCRLMKYNKQAIELNSLLINNMPKDGYG